MKSHKLGMIPIEEYIRRVQVATTMHYQDAVQGVLAMSILGLPDLNSGILRASIEIRLRTLLSSALMDGLLLSVSRMHDSKADTDGIPSILRMLRSDDVRKVVVASGCDHHLDEARAKWGRIRRVSPGYRTLRLLRDSTRAHLIVQKAFNQEGGSVDLFACARETFAVIEHFMLAQGSDHKQLSLRADDWKLMGRDFWARLAGVATG
jgi:hypothetical protein